MILGVATGTLPLLSQTFQIVPIDWGLAGVVGASIWRWNRVWKMWAGRFSRECGSGGEKGRRRKGGRALPAGLVGPNCRALLQWPLQWALPLVGPTQGKPYILHCGYCSNCWSLIAVVFSNNEILSEPSLRGLKSPIRSNLTGEDPLRWSDCIFHSKCSCYICSNLVS